jgi:PAS domain S-box-containing protein
VRRILIIEDDERQAAFLEQLVREQLEGFAVEIARDGAEGLAFISDGNVDVVLLDDNLPDVSAPELLDQIRAAVSIPPQIVVLSSMTDPDAAAAVLQRGVHDFVPKSLDLTRTLPILVRRAAQERAQRRDFDITDDRYQALLEETNAGIYILVGNQFVYVNRRFEEMLGYARDEIVHAEFDYQRLIAPESRPMIRERAERAARGEVLEPRYEFVACNAHGETFDAGVSVAYIEYGGEPATLGIMQDITERKAFDAALIRRNRELAVLNDIAATVNRSLELGTVLDIAAERLMSVMNLAAAGISLVDEKRGVLESHVFRGVTDVFRRHLRAIPIGSGIMGKVAQTGELMVVDDLRTDPRVHINEVRGTGFVSTVSVPIKAQGRVLGVAICFSDRPRAFAREELDLLTHIGNQIGTAVDKAQVYERLKVTVRRLVALDEITRLISGTLDAREVFALAASQLRRLVGCDRVSVAIYDAVNDRFDMHFLAVDGIEVEPSQPYRPRDGSVMGRAIESQHAVVVDLTEAEGEYEQHLARLGGKTFAAVPIVVERSPIGTLNLSWFEPAAVEGDTLEALNALAAHLAVAIKNTRLFSELESTLAELQDTQQRLLKVGRLQALGELAAGVAHDFNNVLGAILGRAQLLKNYVQDEALRKNLDVIERAALDGAATVRRIQQFSRSQTEVEFEPVDIGAVVQQTVEYTQPRWLDRAARDGVHIELDVSGDDAPLILGNAQELREVLTNLINNACDAMHNGGRLSLLVGPCERGAFVEVADTGAGMPLEVSTRVFDPFFTTKGRRGSGLGLSVSYNIIQRHRGSIDLESEEGVGTRFRIELPTSDQPALAPEPVASEAPRAEGARILVIDDEEAIREVLADILLTADHEVVLAEDGPAGIARFSEADFDVVFTDLGMPGMSGFEVARELKRQRPEVPIGLLTGWGANVDEEEMHAAGIDVLVPKPFKYDEVLGLVDEVIALRSKRDG